MTLIKLDSSATNGTPQNFTTTFSNFVLEENGDYEIAMISLSMNYSYPNVSSSNGNNTVEYSPNSGTNFYTVTIPDGNWSVTSLNDYIQGQMKSNGHSSVVNGVDVFDITISPNFNTGLVDIVLSNNFQLRFTSSTFHNLLGFNAVTLTNASNRGGGLLVNKNEDYRFLIKYFGGSGRRRVSEIGFFNFKSAQSFLSSLELLSGLGANHDQAGPTTKCTGRGKDALSGTDNISTESLN